MVLKYNPFIGLGFDYQGLSEGDYIEVWCANNTSATNITVDNLNLMITQLG